MPEDTLRQPHYWLITGLEWPSRSTEDYAECAFAFAPDFAPRSMLSPAAGVILELAKRVAPVGQQRVVMFSELTQTLRKHNSDWPEVGVDDWEATVNELTEAPMPSMYLTLSKYAHIMLCTAGMEHSYVHFPDGRQERIPESDFEDLRSHLRTQLSTDWLAYIDQLERSGKIQSH